jgi:RimJ/RimL family protein N-acetyltransferase
LVENLKDELRMEVREAEPSDKEPLMHFVSKTWGGHDYIPVIWDKWLKDKSGRVFVLVVNGKQVGMNHIRFLPEKVGWLEGARISPEFRGEGLASLLGRKSMKFGSLHGMHIFRLTTSSTNKAARRQIGKMGFSEIARFNVHRVRSGRFRSNASVRTTKLAELHSTWQFIRSTREFALANGLYWDAFVARTLNMENLRELIEHQRVFYSSDSSGLHAAAIFGRVAEGSEIWNQLGFLCGESKPCGKLVHHIFRSAIRAQADENLIFVPMGAGLTKVMKKMGMKRYYQMAVFERRNR